MTASYLIYLPVCVLLLMASLAAFMGNKDPVRLLISLNVLGSSVFLFLGVSARESRAEGVSDPVPQAIVITGIVVAVSATALALSLIRKLRSLQAGGETGEK